MLFSRFHPMAGVSGLLAIFIAGSLSFAADPLYTQEYWLKNTDVQVIIRAINIIVRNPTGKRIMSGQGKHLVVTTVVDEQLEITDILPILDQPTSETNKDKEVIEMITRAARYLKEKKLAYASVQKTATPSSTAGEVAPAPARAPNILAGINSFDLYKTTWSIYAQEDAKIMAQRIVKDDEGGLPSLGDLILRGIFRTASGPPLALLTYAKTNYTARDGSLYERNRTKVKDVSSQVFKDRVILIGPDRIPRVFKFKSTL